MNTLPRVSTAQFFHDADSYNALRSHWRTLMNSDSKRDLDPEHHLLYLALLGKDWRKGFTPITNERKLANGAFYGWALFRALGSLHNSWDDQRLLAPFEGLVTTEMLEQVRRLVPRANANTHHAGNFTITSFPFDAYITPETPSLAAH